MTRAEAIDLAVRRWSRNSPPVYAVQTRGLVQCDAESFVPEKYMRAIRAHFRVICKTYGVKAEAKPDRYDVLWGKPVIYEMFEYDGSGHRI